MLVNHSLRYLHARMAALRVPGPSWFWPQASSSEDLVASIPRGVCTVVRPPYAGASLVLGKLTGMSKVGCARGVPAAQLVGRRSWRRGQTAGGGSIPRWSTGKPQVVTRRKATGAGQKKKVCWFYRFA